MSTTSAPMYRQPVGVGSRPFMHGTTFAGTRLPGPCVLTILVASCVTLFIGFCMAVFSYNYYSCTYRYNYCGFEMTAARKTGIVFVVFGGLALMFGIMLAFKAHNENKLVRGMVVSQGALPTHIPAGPYQASYPVDNQFQQTSGYSQGNYNTGYESGLQKGLLAEQNPVTTHPKQGNENPPPYQNY